MTAPAAAQTDPLTGARTYPIVNPSTGELIELPNCSGILNVIWAGPFLADWRAKMAGLGLAHRTDLQARLAAAHLLPKGKERNGAITAVIEDAVAHGQCLEPGRGFLANDFGTAVHLLTDLVDEDAVPDIMALPDSVAAHIAGYVDTLAGHGITVERHEFTVCHFEVMYAATADKLIRFTRPDDATAALWDQHDLGRGTFICDIKTGTIHDKVAMQLACHANAESIYDASTGAHEALPADLRRDLGFALQLTAKGPSLVPVDLTAAWPAFCGAVAVHRFTTTAPRYPALPAPKVATGAVLADDAAPAALFCPGCGGLLGVGVAVCAACRAATRAAEGATTPASPVEGSAADPMPAADPVPISAMLDDVADDVVRISALLGVVVDDLVQVDLDRKKAWLLERAAALAGYAGVRDIDTGDPFTGITVSDARSHLAATWPAGVPGLKAEHAHNLAELAQIEQALLDTEGAYRVPFPEPWPDPSIIDPVVPAEDPRVAALNTRLAALPADLAAGVAAAKKAAKLPAFASGLARQSHLTQAEALVAEPEPEAARRRQQVADCFMIAGEHHVTAGQLKAVFAPDTTFDRPTIGTLRLLDAVTDAIQGEYLVLVEGALVAAGLEVLAEFNNRSTFLAAAKRAAADLRLGAPANTDEALASPLLVAAVVALAPAAA